LLPNSVTTETTKVKKTVPRYVWDVSLSYNLTVLRKGESYGSASNFTDNASRILLKGDTRVQTVSTPAKASPIRQNFDRALDVPLTWLLQNIASPSSMDTTSTIAAFRIDRLDSSCKTPRRNDYVDSALAFDRELYGWASRVKDYLVEIDSIERSEGNEHGVPTLQQADTSSEPRQERRRLADLLESIDVMVPVAPLMDNRSIMVNDTDLILKEHITSLDGALGKLLSSRGRRQNGETNESLIGYNEASIAALCHHVQDLSQG
jgi:hypothetical protein